MSDTALSVDAVAVRGVSVTRPLRDWLARASFVAKTRTSEVERRRYEQWALHLIDDAARSSGGVDSVNWARMSPVMPPNVPDYSDTGEPTATLVRSQPIVNSTERSSSTAAASASAGVREAIYRETLNRSPAELREFIVKAFDLYDGEVAQRKRSYEQVTFIEMLNIAKNLQRLSEKQKLQRPSPPQQRQQKQQHQQQQPNSMHRVPVAHAPTKELSSSPVTAAPLHTLGSSDCCYGRKSALPINNKRGGNTLYDYPIGASSSAATANARRAGSGDGFRAAHEPPTIEVASFFQSNTHHSMVDSCARESTQLDDRGHRDSERGAPKSRSAASPVASPAQTYVSVIPRMGSESGEERNFFIQLTLSDRNSAADASKLTSTAVGRSNELERLYSRYEPNMDDIRPLPVLIRAFEYIQRRASEKERQDGQLSGRKYLSDQLKGMRQDLHVQSLVNSFTVRVYERHARLCLATGDLGEFNQCQAALKNMYNDARIDDTGRAHAGEFFYYRLAYLWLSEQHDALSTELINFTSAHLRCIGAPKTSKQQVSPSHLSVGPTRAGLQRTLRLCAACDTGDCATAVQILSSYPREMRLLLMMYLQRLRVRWLREVLCAMRGSVSIRFIMSSLGFTPVHVRRPCEAAAYNAAGLEVADVDEAEASRGSGAPRRKRRSAGRDDVMAISNSSKAASAMGGTAHVDGDATGGVAAHRSGMSHADEDDTVHWLDGSHDEARRAFDELFALLKIGMPAGFSFDAELARDTSRDQSGAAHSSPSGARVVSLDAPTATKLVQQYIDYLGTRKDANLS